ncbi:GGDEF domain-containing protein [Pseudomonadota bacterium]
MKRHLKRATPLTESDTQASPIPASVHGRLPVKRLVGVIVAIGLVVTAMAVYSFETGLRMSERYGPLIDAAMEIKLEATTGHLWFEEILSNDRDADIDDVHRYLDAADWYARAMLEGGSNAEGTFVPLDDVKLRAHIEHVRARLATFREIMEARWERRSSSGPRSTLDKDFDLVFSEFIEEADLVETRLQQLTLKAQRTFTFTQAALGFLALVATVLAANIFMRFAREQNETLANLSAEVEQRKAMEDELRQLATTDPLTGLFNRRHITDVLQDEVNRATRQDNVFSVIMFDIDHFKAINDTHGHDVGDRVLKAISGALAKSLREVDVMARWGGEEFLILLRASSLSGAAQVAEKLRAILESATIETAGIVTASFGVAQHHGDESVRELVHRADLALYTAKNGGRNKVVKAENQTD